MHGLGFLAMTCSQAIGAGVTTADDDGSLAFGMNFRSRIERISQAPPVLLPQKLHGKVNAFQFASGHRQIAGPFRATSENDRFVFFSQVFYRNITADMRISDQLHALGHHLIKAAIDKMLLQLELRDAVAQKAANTIRFFVHNNGVTGAAELLSGCQSRRPRSYNGNSFAGSKCRSFRTDQPLRKAAFDDALFDLLNRDWRLINTEYTGSLAGCGTNSPGKFGEIIGGVQLPQSFLPAATVNQIIPIR